MWCEQSLILFCNWGCVTIYIGHHNQDDCKVAPVTPPSRQPPYGFEVALKWLVQATRSDALMNLVIRKPLTHCYYIMFRKQTCTYYQLPTTYYLPAKSFEGNLDLARFERKRQMIESTISQANIEETSDNRPIIIINLNLNLSNIIVAYFLHFGHDVHRNLLVSSSSTSSGIIVPYITEPIATTGDVHIISYLIHALLTLQRCVGSVMAGRIYCLVCPCPCKLYMLILLMIKSKLNATITL